MSARTRLLVLAVATALVVTPGGWVAAQARVTSSAPVLGAVEHVAQTPLSGRDVRLVVDAHGTSTAVWSEQYGTSGRQGLFWIRSAHRSPSGHWSAPRTIGCRRVEGCGRAYPVLGVDGAGTVTVAWPSGRQVLVRTWSRDTGWTVPQIVAEESREVSSVIMSVAPNGTALLTWDFWSERSRIRTARRLAPGVWTQPRTVAYGYAAGGAVAGSGIAVVAYNSSGNACAVRFAPGSGWGRRHCSGFDAWWSYAVDVAMGPGGRALVLWTTEYEDNDTYRAMAREIGPSGTWGAPFLIGPPTAPHPWWIEDSDPGAVIDSHGTETIAWIRTSYDHGDLPYVPPTGWIARRPVGGNWTFTRVRGMAGSDQAQVVVDRAGDLGVAFPQWLVLRPHGGTWTAPAHVAGRIGILPSGAALRMWWDGLDLDAQPIRQP